MDNTITHYPTLTEQLQGISRTTAHKAGITIQALSILPYESIRELAYTLSLNVGLRKSAIISEILHLQEHNTLCSNKEFITLLNEQYRRISKSSLYIPYGTHTLNTNYSHSPRFTPDGKNGKLQVKHTEIQENSTEGDIIKNNVLSVTNILNYTKEVLI